MVTIYLREGVLVDGVGGRPFRKPPIPSEAERLQPRSVDGGSPDRRARDRKDIGSANSSQDTGVNSANEARSRRCRRCGQMLRTTV
jgi:hypothetical protein